MSKYILTFTVQQYQDLLDALLRAKIDLVAEEIEYKEGETMNELEQCPFCLIKQTLTPFGVCMDCLKKMRKAFTGSEE